MPIRRTSVNQAELDRILRSPAGPVFQRIDGLAAACEAEAKGRCKVDEGRLRASISHYTRVEGTRVIGRVGSDLHYAIYVHEGTGIYGPRRAPIYPVSSRVLVFEPGRMIGPLPRGAKHPPKGSRGKVFARSVKGSPPHPFLLEAFTAVSPWPVRIHR